MKIVYALPFEPVVRIRSILGLGLPSSANGNCEWPLTIHWKCLFVSNQWAFNVSRISGRSALIVYRICTDINTESDNICSNIYIMRVMEHGMARSAIRVGEMKRNSTLSREWSPAIRWRWALCICICVEYSITTATVPASEVEALIWSPTNTAAAEVAAVHFIKITSLTRPACLWPRSLGKIC